MDIQVLASSSAANCYVIGDGATTVLVECGLRWAKIAEHFNYNVLRKISGVFISHEHADHSCGAKQAAEAGLDVYASAGTLKALNLSMLNNYHYKTIQHGKQVKIGTLLIMPFATEHDAAEPLGFLIYSSVTKERLLFATDTYYIHWQFPKLNYIMIECNYDIEIVKKNIESGNLNPALVPRLLQNHMSFDTTKSFIKHQDLSCVKTIYLLHASAGNSDVEYFRQEIIAETGLPTIIGKEG